MKLSRPLLALMLTLPLALGARADAPAPTALAPLQGSPVQSQAMQNVYGLLSNSRLAYRPRALDAAMVEDVFKRYLEALDPAKMFLTADDVAGFQRWKSNLAASIRAGDTAAAYAIFDVYKQRAEARLNHARGLLAQDIFQFDGDERWYYDRKDAAWASDATELDALWRQSVRNDWLRLQLAGRKPEEIRTTLDRRYQRNIRDLGELKGEDIFQTFMNAYAGAVDPHTAYYNPRNAELFDQQMSLSLEGIGAVLQRQDEVVVIREIVPGGPAALSGKLKPGDRIVGVGQGAGGAVEDVIGWRIDDVVEKIKGPKDTVVRLDVIPAEAGLDSPPARISITRARVRLEEQAAKSEVIEIPAVGDLPLRRIGVIKLPAFYSDFEGRRQNNGDYASATRDVERILRGYRGEGVDGVVLDLRRNGGGSLSEAIELTGLFIEGGPVVQVRQSGGRVSVESDGSDAVAWGGPLAVLIDRASASASEIFAGAIQDYGRGLVIGENSFGKGTVQNLADLDRWPGRQTEPLGRVKLTVAQFFLPGGASTQNRGVVPDIAFPVTVDASEYGESTYDNAIPWTRITAVPHARYGEFAGMLPRLQARHDARVARDVEWQWWFEDVAESRAEREKKYVSLNLAERRAERERQEAKRKQRQERRQALGLPLDPLAEGASDDGLSAAERNVVEDARREKAAEKAPDPLLRESAAILADATLLLRADPELAGEVLTSTRGRDGRWVR
ncbi:MAG: carboxy terminal-processing peptidase [Pseudoxanthomonas suwonensis]|nr:carboxy terminal-processing peptidase [Pseudoxanthomonas suwonensis]